MNFFCNVMKSIDQNYVAVCIVTLGFWRGEEKNGKTKQNTNTNISRNNKSCRQPVPVTQPPVLVPPWRLTCDRITSHSHCSTLRQGRTAAILTRERWIKVGVILLLYNSMLVLWHYKNQTFVKTMDCNFLRWDIVGDTFRGWVPWDEEGGGDP